MQYNEGLSWHFYDIYTQEWWTWTHKFMSDIKLLSNHNDWCCVYIIITLYGNLILLSGYRCHGRQCSNKPEIIPICQLSTIDIRYHENLQHSFSRNLYHYGDCFTAKENHTELKTGYYITVSVRGFCERKEEWDEKALERWSFQMGLINSFTGVCLSWSLAIHCSIYVFFVCYFISSTT